MEMPVFARAMSSQVKQVCVLGMWLILLGAYTPVWACGWWGDGESDAAQKTVLVGKDGKPIPDEAIGAAAIADMKVPEQSGYGVAVYLADKAIPYLRAIKDRRINTIGQLKKQGFVSVVDIGSGAHASAAHKAQSRDLGMHYFHIAVDQAGFATRAGIKELHKIIQNFKLRPLLIYASRVDVLATAWGRHRTEQGRRWNIIEKDVKQLGISEGALAKLKAAHQ